MANFKLEINAEEKAMIIRGLRMLEDDAGKILASEQRMGIDKAAGETGYFKEKIQTLTDKVAGKQKLL